MGVGNGALSSLIAGADCGIAFVLFRESVFQIGLGEDHRPCLQLLPSRFSVKGTLGKRDMRVGIKKDKNPWSLSKNYQAKEVKSTLKSEPREENGKPIFKSPWSRSESGLGFSLYNLMPWELLPVSIIVTWLGAIPIISAIQKKSEAQQNCKTANLEEERQPAAVRID
ncbi:hypothetical protein CEXT_32751 [Caerostris extrusa]|uniref:Uncharacterized protein n=1 Tax=Caerostris extrusa TaxID=172846 RepID=A0AAV4SI39_CAEEX|nr:hypothetical protein CEXT_32751 [Caerostris extrusa]